MLLIRFVRRLRMLRNLMRAVCARAVTSVFVYSVRRGVSFGAGYGGYVTTVRSKRWTVAAISTLCCGCTGWRGQAGSYGRPACGGWAP